MKDVCSEGDKTLGAADVIGPHLRLQGLPRAGGIAFAGSAAALLFLKSCRDHSVAELLGGDLRSPIYGVCPRTLLDFNLLCPPRLQISTHGRRCLKGAHYQTTHVFRRISQP